MNKYFILLRRAIYIFFGVFDEVLGKRKISCIYAYHSLGDKWYFDVKQDDFVQQLKEMKKTGSVVSVDSIVNKLKESKPNKLFYSVTFDDGYKSVLDAAKIMSQMKIEGSVFLLNSPEKSKAKLNYNQGFMSRTDIQKLINLGWQIGSHGGLHQKGRRLNRSQIEQEVKSGIESISSFKLPYKLYSYPYGEYTSFYKKTLKKYGFKYAFSMDDNFAIFDDYSIPRIGVDSSHSLQEFKYLNSPTVIKVRKLLKKIYVHNYEK